MSLLSTLQTLIQQSGNQSLTIDSDTLDSPSIAALLALIPPTEAAAFPNGQIAITGADVAASSTASDVVVTGSTIITAPNDTLTSALPATATFYVDANGNTQIILALTLDSGASLTTIFPQLLTTSLGTFTFLEPALVYSSSNTTTSPAWSTGLNFASFFGPGTVPPEVLFLLPQVEMIPLSGTIVPPPATATQPSGPIVSLSTQPYPVNLGPFSVSSMLQLSTVGVTLTGTTPPEQLYYGTIELIFDLTIAPNSPPEQISIDLTAPLGNIVATASGLTVPLGDWSDLSAVAPGADFSSVLPPDVPTPPSLTVTDITLVLTPNSPAVTAIGITVLLGDLDWTIIQPSALVLNAAMVKLAVGFGGSTPSVEVTLAGFFDVAETAIIELAVTVPEMQVTAALVPPSQIPLVPGSVPFFSALSDVPIWPQNLAIGALDLTADFTAQTFAIEMEIGGIVTQNENGWSVASPMWTIDLPTGTSIQIDNLGLVFVYAPGSTTLGVAGTFAIGQTNPLSLDFAMSYGSGDNWSFLIETAPGTSLNIADALSTVLDSTLGSGSDSWWPSSIVPQTLEITDIYFEGTTSSSAASSYSFGASTTAQWEIAPGDDDLTIDATVNVTYDGTNLSGTIGGVLEVNGLTVSVSYAFQHGSDTITASLDYNGVALSGTISYGEGQDTIVTFQLAGVTFGEIVDWLVDLVDPSLDFKLTSPWDVLNQINLSALTLQVDVTQKTVSANITLSENLGFIDIETITLTYLSAGGSGTVTASVTGSFAGQSFGNGSPPLQWDMLHGTPPSPAGQGLAALSVQYLGIGENVAFVGANATTLGEVLQGLIQTVSSSSGSTPWQNLQLSTGNDLFVGTQFRVMNTLTFGAVFDDPTLYGLGISLAGPIADALSGLSFEILYQSLSPTLGVYSIDLQLPASMQHIELGEVVVTLPQIGIQIWTNGDFYIDFGYPQNGSFYNSLGVAVLPFTGAGGFYFGVVPAQSATNLPAVSNGTMSPVVEFGFALEIGTGVEVSAGPLSGGATIAVAGSLAGVLSWFNPTDAGVAPARYYWIQGSLGIIGQLWAQVDFVVIKVNVTAMATATATLTIESYEPILIELAVTVQVYASVTIVFVTIHFTFSTSIDCSFTIGSGSTPPWQLAPGESGEGNGTLVRAPGTAMARRRRFARARAFRKPTPFVLTPQDPTAIAMDWTAPGVVPGAGPTVSGTLLPALTYDTGGAMQVVMLVTLSSVQPLMNLMWHWSLRALRGNWNGTVSIADLQNIHDALTAEMALSVFSGATLDAALVDNCPLVLSRAATDALSGVLFPMPPQLVMTPTGGAPVQFSSINRVDSTYLEKVDAYFAQFLGNSTWGPATQPQSEDVPVAPPPPPLQIELSMPQNLLADYILLVARATVQNAITTMSAPSYTPTATDTLASITRQFALSSFTYQVQTDDTLTGIATAFGVSPAAIQEANAKAHIDWNAPFTLPLALIIPEPWVDLMYDWPTPGFTKQGALAMLAASFGTPLAGLEQANRGLPDEIAAGTPIIVPVNSFLVALGAAASAVPLAQPVTLYGVTYTIQFGDTFQSVAASFGVPIDALAALNASRQSWLAPNATILVEGDEDGIPYVCAAGDTAGLVAAYVLTRCNVLSGSTALLQALSTSNPRIVDPSKPLPPGTILQLPAGFSTPAYSASTYSTKDGDTLDLIAGYFSVLTANPPTPSYTSAVAALAGQIIAPGATVNVPGQVYQLEAQDTLTSIADPAEGGVGVPVAEIVGANYGAGSPIDLVPGATLLIPPFAVAADGTATIASIAQNFALTQEAVIGMVALVPGLFAGASLTLPPLFGIEIAKLTAMLAATEEQSSGIGGMTSRFLLHGVQLPDPNDPTFNGLTVEEIAAGAANGNITVTPLYTLTGQQFAAPANVQDLLVRFRVDLNAGSPWVSFPWEPFQDPWGPYDVMLPTGTLIPSWPFVPTATTPPSILPAAQRVPTSYPLTTTIAWSAATLPPYAPSPTASGPTPPDAQPTLWLFGSPVLDAIEANIAASDGPVAYQLLMNNPLQSGAAGVEAPWYDWATVVPFTVAQVPSVSGGPPMPNTVQLIGTNQNSSRILAELVDYLNGPAGDAAQVFLLYAPPAGSGLPSTLYSDTLDLNLTFILQTNLSTQPEPPSTGNAPPETTAQTYSLDYELGPIEAPIWNDDGTGGNTFVQLLWQCSVVGTAGGATVTGGASYLNYETSGSFAGLPGTIFANGGQATLWAAILLTSETGTMPSRVLQPFHNCAVLAGSVNSAEVCLSVANPGDPTEVANIPPGNLGYTWKVPNASMFSPGTTLELFQLLGASLPASANSTYLDLAQGFPIGPQRLPGEVVDANGTVFLKEYWLYQQLFPLAALLASHPVQPAAALPPVDQNPYAGVVLDSQTDGPFQGPQATLQLTMYDVFGNAAPSMPVLAPLTIDVGYYDPVLGLGNWPAATTSFDFSTADCVAQLVLSITFDPSRYAATSNPSATPGACAKADLTTYSQIYYQIQQPDMQAIVATCFDDPASLPNANPALLARLQTFASAACIFLRAAATLAPARVAPGAATPLGTFLGDNAIDAGEFFTANASTAAASLFVGTITVPQLFAVASGLTIGAIAANANVTVETVVERNDTIPLAAGADLAVGVAFWNVGASDTLQSIALLVEISVVDLVVANANVPNLLAAGGTLQSLANDRTISLQELAPIVATQSGLLVAGAALALTGVAVSSGVPAGRIQPVAPDLPRGELAAIWQCSVSALGAANAQTPRLFAEGASISAGGVAVTAEEEDTLLTLTRKFAAQGVDLTIPALAVAIQWQPVLAVGGVWLITDHIVQPKETFADIAQAFEASLGWLAQLNSDGPANVFPAGTSLVLSQSSVLPQSASQTIAALAAAHGLVPSQLGPFNDATMLSAEAIVTLPNAQQFTGGTWISLPYQANGSQSAKDIAAVLSPRFTSVVLSEIETRNANMPGFQSSGPLVPGTLLVVPPPSAAGRTLDEVARDLRVDLPTLAVANGSLYGLLEPGVTITAGGKPLTVGPTDTLQSLVARFAAAGVNTTIPLLAQTTKAIRLRADASMLIPPQAAAVSVPIAQPFLPGPIFPLSVTIELARNAALVAPAFRSAEQVLSATTAVGANTTPSGAASAGAAHSLRQFASHFIAAFAPQGLTLGLGPNADQRTSAPLWATVVPQSPTADVQVAPRYFGIAPLSTQPVVLAGLPPSDPEVWMRELLAAIDLFLTPQWVIPAYLNNPAAVQQVLEAKALLAQGIAGQVTPIFPGSLIPDPSDQATLLSAQLAVEQNLLVSLSQTYATDTVVQLTMSAPSPFSGNLVVQSGQTPEEIAAWYQVNVQAFLVAAENIAGILTAGYQVEDGSQTYTINAGDTLGTVAGYFGMSTVLPLQPLLGAGAFAANATIPLVAIAKTVQPGETFRSLANYFNNTPQNVGLAVQSVQNIFAPGVTIPGATAPVQEGNTLGAVAASLYTTPDQLAESLAGVPGLLNPGITLYAMTQSTDDPAMSASAALEATSQAPQLFGAVTPSSYIVPAGGQSLAQLHDALPVSLDALVEAIAGMTVLHAGITIRYELDGTWKETAIASSDTLASLAKTNHVSTDAFARAVFHCCSLFAPHARIRLILLRATPEGGGTLASVAAALGVDIPVLAVHNETLGSIFASGARFEIDGHLFEPGSRSLSEVARHFRTTVAALASMPSLSFSAELNPNVTLYVVVPIPHVSITSASLPLANQPSYLNLFVSITDEANNRTLPLALDFEGRQLEFGMQLVPDAEGVVTASVPPGYVGSSWLNLIAPPPPLSLPAMNVPIPLRFCPPTPAMLSQRWAPTIPEPPLDEAAWVDALRWSLELAWQHRDAAQDTTTIAVSYNAEMPPPLPTGPTETLQEHQIAFYTSLANFNAVWTPMQQTLAGLTAGGTLSAPVAAAIESFAQLVYAVASSWAPGSPTVGPQGPGTGTMTFAYNAAATYVGTGADRMRSLLVLSLDSADAPPAPPEIYVPASAKAPLTRFTAPGGELIYSYPPGIAASTPLLHRVVFPSNMIMQQPNGVAWVSVLRNGSLSSTESPFPAFESSSLVGFYAGSGTTAFVTPYLQNNFPLNAGYTPRNPPIGSPPLYNIVFTPVMGLYQKDNRAWNNESFITMTVDYGLTVNQESDLHVLIPMLHVPETPLWSNEPGQNVNVRAAVQNFVGVVVCVDGQKECAKGQEQIVPGLSGQINQWLSSSGLPQTYPDYLQFTLMIRILPVPVTNPQNPNPTGTPNPPLLRFTKLRLYFEPIIDAVSVSQVIDDAVADRSA